MRTFERIESRKKYDFDDPEDSMRARSGWLRSVIQSNYDNDNNSNDDDDDDHDHDDDSSCESEGQQRCIEWEKHIEVCQ